MGIGFCDGNSSLHMSKSGKINANERCRTAKCLLCIRTQIKQPKRFFVYHLSEDYLCTTCQDLLTVLAYRCGILLR